LSGIADPRDQPRALRIAGEHAYRVPSLNVPPLGLRPRLKAVEAVAYGALFAERAAATDSRFVLTDANAPTVSDICRRLDGIPLAIELAAARVTILSADALAQRLDQRFAILTRGERTVLPRHHTMRALFDWSYELLPPTEQRAFESLAVFAGGCALAEATAVCADDGTSAQELLASLVGKSLVTIGGDGSTLRYLLSESAREYAREKLTTRGFLPTAANRHAQAYLALAERLERVRDATNDPAWHAQAEAELDNWRAALEWTLDARREPIVGQRLAGARRARPGRSHYPGLGRGQARPLRSQLCHDPRSAAGCLRGRNPRLGAISAGGRSPGRRAVPNVGGPGLGLFGTYLPRAKRSSVRQCMQHAVWQTGPS
jgi:hypothetical protein